jgi:hypothetical protein
MVTAAVVEAVTVAAMPVRSSVRQETVRVGQTNIPVWTQGNERVHTTVAGAVGATK